MPRYSSVATAFKVFENGHKVKRTKKIKMWIFEMIKKEKEKKGLERSLEMC